MRNILGRHRLRAVAAVAAVLTLMATPSAGSAQKAGTIHNHDAHVHSANAPAAVASAEPDFSATLNAANPKFTWESSGSGVSAWFAGRPNSCTGAPFTCDYILLNVETAGELTLTLDSTDVVCGDSTCELVQDKDGRLYMSNAAGEPQGYSLTGGCISDFSSETCKVAVAPGFYVFEVEYSAAVEASYIGTAELVPAPPGPPAAAPQTIAVEGCNFTLYYFNDSIERLQAFLPPGHRVRRRPDGSGTIAAAAYDCDRIEVPGSSPAPGIFTMLSVLVNEPGKETDGDGPTDSDFYVLWVHADNPQLVELLASGGMPAYLVPGMVFEKPALSLAVRVEVPWSLGAYELATPGYLQDIFHDHANSFWHDAADGRRVRMDFLTAGVRDQFCLQLSSDNHAGECGTLTAQAGTPIASFLGASERSADNAWDHDPIEGASFVLNSCRRPPGSANASQCLPSPAGANDHEHQHEAS